MTDLMTFDFVTSIVENRNAALDKIIAAQANLKSSIQEAKTALDLSRRASNGVIFYDDSRRKREAYSLLFPTSPSQESVDCFRSELDASIWQYLFEHTGINDCMDAVQKKEWRNLLLTEVPEITEENIRATFEGLAMNAGDIFRRGAANAFSKLDKRFKSHDAFKIGSRIILTYVFDDWGHFRYRSEALDTLIDVERVFAKLDGKAPEGSALLKKIEEDRKHKKSLEPCQSVTETEYFRIKGYKNGNVHLWFLRDDLVEKVNRTLAEYYGEVLPDGVEKAATSADIKRSTAVSKNLQFYRTPEKTVKRVLQDVYLREGMKILEPSAGDGAFVKEILKAPGVTVDAIEIDFDRAAILSCLPRDPGRMNVQVANFLNVAPRPEYNAVIMNPPFYGTHWMQHVMHAWDFLAPGGQLVAILPVTADVGETTKHAQFRAWVEKNDWRGYGSRFRDLPEGSFEESGTMINTVVLTMQKAPVR